MDLAGLTFRWHTTETEVHLNQRTTRAPRHRGRDGSVSDSRPSPRVGRIVWCCWVLVWAMSGGNLAWADRVDFNREIRPILADTCFKCHGFDAAARKAGLRLDLRADALKPTKSGAVPIVPGQPEASDVVRRLFAASPEDLMPPPELHRALTTSQKELLRRWIAEGAEYAGHWAFAAPVSPPVPEIKNSKFQIHNGIDAFIVAELRKKGLDPSREADRSTLIRRVSLDLTGLPPRPEEVAAFLADRSIGAWERVVDRLLASPHYGERMAQDWLDAARFADSNGYQVDRDREMWAWRDWVVRAFNANLPFDHFTVEQFAGDLLPGATWEQRVATGFHRNHMINEEGGIIPEEFLNEYCADRVETMATVWLGLTFNCARCHDHKYDPVTQRDFYGLYAFFHNIDEKGVGDYAAPYRRSSPPFELLPAPEVERKRAQLSRDLGDEETQLHELANQWEARAWAAQPVWRELGSFQPSGTPLEPEPAVAISRASTATVTKTWTGHVERLPATVLQLRFSRPDLDFGKRPLSLAVHEIRVSRADALSETTPPTNDIALRARALLGSADVTELARALDQKPETFWSVHSTNDAGVVATFDVSTRSSDEPSAFLRFELDLSAQDFTGDWRLQCFETEIEPELLLPPDLPPILAKTSTDRTEAERKRSDEFRFAHSPAQREKQKRIAELRQRIGDAENTRPVTLVLAEMATPRTTFVLKRGAYDQPGEGVAAATPACLPPFSRDFPRNRLGLARWLMEPGNPLPARVQVNRLWQACFGIGLVRTAEDFGAQGEWPSHPELLDWLATEFVRSGWDMKAMMRLLVTSATYRQDSRMTPEMRSLDPENRLLARGPRFRLSAETIRDQALAVSGLLVPQLAGPSVKPYHPPGLYEQVVAGSGPETYVMDHGPSLYRRTLYTYWKRSVPNPALLLFDRPFRETCVVRRARTSTPLQALNLLNDPTYVEAARSLAQRMMRDGGKTPEARIGFGFQAVLARRPLPAELAVLTAGWRRAEASFRTDPLGAGALLTVGESPVNARIDPVPLAAYTLVASTLLNLDEAITKE